MNKTKFFHSSFIPHPSSFRRRWYSACYSTSDLKRCSDLLHRFFLRRQERQFMRLKTLTLTAALAAAAGVFAACGADTNTNNRALNANAANANANMRSNSVTNLGANNA